MASSEAAADLPLHLQGNYAPVGEERTEFDRPVEAGTPPELRGVRIENGTACRYRNRRACTRPFEDANAQRIGSDGTVDRRVAVANTNVEVIGVRAPSTIEDLAITERNAVFMDPPIVFNPELPEPGRFAYPWSGDYGSDDRAILDARAFSEPPRATIRLPQRVPFGCHGDWIADAP